MLYDHKITKPSSMNTYAIHSMIEGLFKDEGKRNLFCDMGDYALVRSTKKEIAGNDGIPVKNLNKNDIAFVELRASCYVSGGGKKFFLKQGDWRARHTWLEKKGSQNGFQVLTMTCQSKLLKVPKPGAEFTLDCTDFSACLKVTDTSKFTTALHDGIGSKGRAFGFGMLVL